MSLNLSCKNLEYFLSKQPFLAQSNRMRFGKLEFLEINNNLIYLEENSNDVAKPQLLALSIEDNIKEHEFLPSN